MVSVVEGDDFGVPAGWYPDPLGLPQLRWWDGEQWSEFTSESQAAEAEAAESAQEQPTQSAVEAAVESPPYNPAPEGLIPEPSRTTYSIPEVPADMSVDPLAEFLTGSVTGITGVTPTVAPTPSPQAPGDDDDDIEATIGSGEFTPYAGASGDDFAALREAGIHIITEPGAAPVPPMPPIPGRPADVEPPLPEVPPADPAPVVPEPFVAAPEPADPFANAPSTVHAPPAPEFSSRKARRAYERQLEIESGGGTVSQPGVFEGAPSPHGFAPTVDGAGPAADYAVLDTNPVRIQPGSGGAVIQPGAASAPAAAPATTAPSLPEPSAADVRHGDALAGAAPAPMPAAVHTGAGARAFSLDDVEVADGFAPERSLIAKKTYTGAASLLAMIGAIQVVVIFCFVYLLGLADEHPLVWAVWGGGWLAGILLAAYDRLKLRSWGHERTASPALAILTPIVYLIARSAATRRETGHGRQVFLTWFIAVVIMAAFAYLFPAIITATVPGFVPPWTSPLDTLDL